MAIAIHMLNHATSVAVMKQDRGLNGLINEEETHS
jgi:hypothetical protein